MQEKGLAVSPANRSGRGSAEFLWRPGEKGIFALWLAGRRKASGFPGAAEVGLILGAS